MRLENARFAHLLKNSGLSVVMALLAACGGGETAQNSNNVPNSKADQVSVTQLPPIAPTDFVIAPCRGVANQATCAIVAAGGKRVLLGAPSGVGAGKIAGDETPPDAVILLSMHANAIEGLDEVRNRIWTSDRPSTLMVIGTDGVEAIVSGLNAAFVIPDALAYVSGDRSGGFDSVPIAAKTVGVGDIAFDTGDLKITAYAAGGGWIALHVIYDGKSALISGCSATDAAVSNWPQADAYIGCPGLANDVSDRQVDFPPQTRIHVK